MLKKIKNLVGHYRKKARIYVPYHFDKLRGKKIFDAKYYGVPLIMYADTHYQHHILNTQRKSLYEPHILAEWMEICKGKKCILDIGGYNGMFGIIAAKLNPDAKVFIFEPDATNFRHMAKNVELNKLSNVTPLKIALSDREGEIIFGGHAGGTGAKIGFGVDKVKTVSLDSFLKENNIKPDLMKIDVEGAEAMVFQGGGEFFMSDAKMQILLEVHFNFLPSFNSSADELFKMIDTYGGFERTDLEDRRSDTYTVKLSKF